VPDEIALQRQIVVALVLDPAEAAPARPGLDLGARNREQRPEHLRARPGKRAQRGHPCHAERTRPAQQLQQQRLGLVVPMVGQNDEVAVLAREDFVARAPRLALEAERARVTDPRMLHLQGHAQSGAQRLAEQGPLRRIRADAVIDVQCAKREPHRAGEIREDRQQRDRVEPPRETGHQMRSGSHQRPQHRCNGLGYAT